MADAEFARTSPRIQVDASAAGAVGAAALRDRVESAAALTPIAVAAAVPVSTTVPVDSFMVGPLLSRIGYELSLSEGNRGPVRKIAGAHGPVWTRSDASQTLLWTLLRADVDR